MGETYPRVVGLLKREFEEKKVTKYAFCKKTGINPTSVDRYLCGISEPTDASLQKLANYFNVTVPWLRGNAPEIYQEAKRNIDETFLEEIIKFVDGYYFQKNIYISFEKRARLYAKLYYQIMDKGEDGNEIVILEKEGEQLLKKLQEELQ